MLNPRPTALAVVPVVPGLDLMKTGKDRVVCWVEGIFLCRVGNLYRSLLIILFQAYFQRHPPGRW